MLADAATRHLLLALLAATCLAGCDTDVQLREQRTRLAEAEKQALSQALEYLREQPDLTARPSARLFLSRRTLDALLVGANGTSFDIPEADGAKLVVDSVKTDLRFGLGGIAIRATASKPGFPSSVEVEGVARLDPVIDAQEPGKIVLRIHVESLVPNARWGWHDLAFGRFIRDIAQARLQERLALMPAIVVPVTTSIPFDVADSATSIAVTGARGILKAPALSLAASLRMSRVLFMPEGMFVFADVTMEYGKS